MNIKTVETVLNHLHSEDPIELTIHITPSVARRLVAESRDAGIAPDELAALLIDGAL